MGISSLFNQFIVLANYINRVSSKASKLWNPQNDIAGGAFFNHLRHFINPYPKPNHKTLQIYGEELELHPS